MRNRRTARALHAIPFVLSMGCGGVMEPTQPVLPPELGPVTEQPPAPPAPAFPPLARPGVIYVGNDSIYDAFASYNGSRFDRYVLYEDGTFALQFTSQRFGFLEYTGRFRRADSQITFDWDGWSTAGPWLATGAFAGDTLSVKYNIVMSLTDFIDGVYVREPASSPGRP